MTSVLCPNNVECECRTAVLEYLVAHVQAGRILMTQQDADPQGDTHMAPASPPHQNVSMSVHSLFQPNAVVVDKYSVQHRIKSKSRELGLDCQSAGVLSQQQSVAGCVDTDADTPCWHE